MSKKIRRYGDFKARTKDSNYLLLLTRYFDSVQDDMKKVLMSNKKMSEDDASDFMEKLFSLGQKRMKDLKEEVADLFNKGLSSTDCAKEMVDKYYSITKVNKYETTMDTDEVTEVTEVNEKSSFYHWKRVSPSLFWNFIMRVNRLDVKFVFDTSYINKISNSLNDNDYQLYMETPNVDSKSVEYEFMYSKLLSKVVNVLDANKYGTGIKFFIAVDKNTQLKFGYLINDKRYTIGGFNYKSKDIYKLRKFISSKSEVNFEKMSSSFKTSLAFVNYYKSIITSYFNQYNDTLNGEAIDIYISAINDKLALVIDTSDDNSDILNKNYIERILQNNISSRLKKKEFSVEEIVSQGKTHYYIILK